MYGRVVFFETLFHDCKPPDWIVSHFAIKCDTSVVINGARWAVAIDVQTFFSTMNRNADGDLTVSSTITTGLASLSLATKDIGGNGDRGTVRKSQRCANSSPASVEDNKEEIQRFRDAMSTSDESIEKMNCLYIATLPEQSVVRTLRPDGWLHTVPISAFPGFTEEFWQEEKRKVRKDASSDEVIEVTVIQHRKDATRGDMWEDWVVIAPSTVLHARNIEGDGLYAARKFEASAEGTIDTTIGYYTGRYVLGANNELIRNLISREAVTTKLELLETTRGAASDEKTNDSIFTLGVLDEGATEGTWAAVNGRAYSQYPRLHLINDGVHGSENGPGGVNCAVTDYGGFWATTMIPAFNFERPVFSQGACELTISYGEEYWSSTTSLSDVVAQVDAEAAAKAAADAEADAEVDAAEALLTNGPLFDADFMAGVQTEEAKAAAKAEAKAAEEAMLTIEASLVKMDSMVRAVENAVAAAKEATAAAVAATAAAVAATAVASALNAQVPGLMAALKATQARVARSVNAAATAAAFASSTADS